MRSYGQYCSVAKALDLVGDRWNLLIVRELLLQGRSRYTDLLRGLPGIATNLLADRLRDLQQAGIVDREDIPPPIARTLFSLTERGRALEPAMRELGRWGIRLMDQTDDGDVFRGHWLAFPVELLLSDQTPDRPPIAIQVLMGDEPMIVETIAGAVRARAGIAEEPDLVLEGAPPLVLGVLSAKVGVGDARALGLRCEGDPELLDRLRAPVDDPGASPAPAADRPLGRASRRP